MNVLPTWFELWFALYLRGDRALGMISPRCGVAPTPPIWRVKDLFQYHHLIYLSQVNFGTVTLMVGIATGNCFCSGLQTKLIKQSGLARFEVNGQG